MSSDDEQNDPTATLRKKRAPKLRLKLMVISGPDTGRALPLPVGPYRVGKAPTCDLVLSDKTVSRHHLTLEVREDGVRAVDAGSRNGSYCEGMLFNELEIRLGAIISVGTTLFKVIPEDGRERNVALSTRERFGALTGTSLPMRELFTLLERLAPGDADVLIQGETGTGKELCAEAIHTEGPRAKAPFVVVDLAGGGPASLIESELFGHIKGSFTGAHADRVGAFERAHGGTVFLDEVGDLPLDLQPRLLRVLERRQVKRVGSNEYRTVDVRVVAATHVDLEAEVRNGRFRQDLFHRLAVLRVMLPPLRERPEDIPMLIDGVLKRLEKPPGTLSDQTRALLTQYPWPGNVRELRNVVEQVVSLGEQALPDLDTSSTQTVPDGPDLSVPFKKAKERIIQGFERDYLSAMIERCEGNISRAAREAGIERVYMRKLLHEHGLIGDD